MLNAKAFEEDKDFVELDRSPSKFDMPLNEETLDAFLLGNSPDPASFPDPNLLQKDMTSSD